MLKAQLSFRFTTLSDAAHVDLPASSKFPPILDPASSTTRLTTVHCCHKLPKDVSAQTRTRRVGGVVEARAQSFLEAARVSVRGHSQTCSA